MLALGQVSAAEKITYYHLDALGSPIAATDESGNLAWKEAYKPYGERIRKEDGGDNSQWYTGKQEDADNGLTYFGARWYDPTIGRFMGIDPVGVQEDNIHSFNRFAYANNNPYKFVDPDGEDAVLVSPLIPLSPAGHPVFNPGNPIHDAHMDASRRVIQYVSGTAENIKKNLYIKYMLSAGLAQVMFNKDSSDDGNKADKEKISREKGKRFKSGDDPLQQLDEIERAQRKVRQGKSKQIIDSIEKSRQRSKNFLKDLTKKK